MKINSVLILFFLSPLIGISQIMVSTFEGSDSIKIDDAVYVAKDGSVFGSHFEGTSVYKIEKNGIAHKFVDGISGSNGLEFDSSGNLYVVGHKSNKVYKVAPDGSKTEFVPFIHRPSGIIKMPDSDTMLITRYYADIILKVAPDGTMDTLAMGDLLNGPVGLVYDENNELYTGNFDDRKIIHLRNDGTQHEIVQIPGGQNLGFIAYHNGMFYATSFQRAQIYQVRKSDTLMSLLAGGSQTGELDGDTSVALFNRPNGIAMSLTGDSIYVSDYATQNVRIISGYSIPNSILKIYSAVNVSTFPNPVQSRLTVKVNAERSFVADVSLIAVGGKVVWQKKLELNPGDNNTNLNVEKIASGSYFLKITAEDTVVIKKIIIQ